MSAPHYQPGTYVCRVTQQGFGESSNGNPMIMFGVQPTHRVVVAADGSETLDRCDQSYDRTVRLVIANEDQKEYALLKLRYAGFIGDSFSQLNLVDMDVRCTCDHRAGQGEYADKQFEQWDFILPPRERTPLKPLDTSAARKLDALFGRKLKDGAPKPPVAAAASEAAPSSNNDDVPW